MHRLATGQTLLAATLLGGLTAPALHAAPVTKTFQLGRDGFSGVRDTWVARLDWDTPPQHTVNYGQNTILRLSRDGGENPLVRFDLSSIPLNSAVSSATLELYNTTEAPGRLRRVLVHRVLGPWDEGNQVSSPINAAGKRGATGDNAFAYFPGEGTNVPWTERGMAAGTDYEATAAAATDVTGTGWTSWELTALVRSWVRAAAQNAGVVLRDATGYEDGNPDLRDFVSSQGADATRRPRLTVTYDPDTPYADAGPDQASLAWNGGAVALDGSASHDRPGGSDATLTYAWKVVAAGYGSALGGATVGTTRTPSFTPDVAGEWDLELTVTNDVGSSATDRVHLRLLAFVTTHPRILLTPARLATLHGRAVPGNPRWTALLGEADSDDGDTRAKALVSRVTGTPSYCDDAVTRLLAQAADPASWSSKAGEMAVVYDWCHDRLSAAQKTTLVGWFNAWGDDTAHHGEDVPGWGNYWPRWSYSYALVGLATYGDNPRAQQWMDEYRLRRVRDYDLPLLDRIADGGGWPEGMIYDWIANLSRYVAVEAWRTATGEDLWRSTRWFEERLPYQLLHRWPGVADQWGHLYHPYVSTGDTERNRGSMANYERIMGLILVDRFPASPWAPQLQALLATPPTDGSMGFLAHDEFLWFDPGKPTATPTALTHVARGIGSVFARSGWPAGAADTDPGAAYLTFQCGDHFTYHQHYDQNSFTLRKGDDLLVDSGVYSGQGTSFHDVNYYVRTVAHNTLTVFNPAEDFGSARPDAESNDGGQRTMAPASRYPPGIEYFDQHATHYETGNLLRVSDATTHTYALGDATRAYNGPAYSQSTDAGLAGNVPKVSRFQRELAYLRPAAPGGDDFVVLLDRVGVTQPAFSGASTRLLFHTLSEPAVDGTSASVSPGETLHSGAGLAVADRGASRLFLRALLPQARNLRKVGGRGVKAFFVNGTNYDWQWSPTEPQPRPVNDFEDEPYGEWRLSLEPADTALEHTFLTVIQPTTTARAAMTPAQVVSATGVVGVHLADGTRNRVALFSAAVDGAPLAGQISYTYTPTAPTSHLVADLVPGTAYALVSTTSGATRTVTLTPSATGSLVADAGGVLAFQTAGTAPPAGTALTIDDLPGDGRFQVTLDWTTVQGGGQSGKAQAISTAPVGVTSGGLFWFFAPSNPEVLVKVLNGCGVNGHYWAFASAGTNVGLTLTFTDTKSARTKTYTSPDLTPAAPVQDTAAFTCP